MLRRLASPRGDTGYAMPKRSNPFQQLIAMVVELLEDGEEVTESVEFPDPTTGRPREVDILVVRGKLNGQPVRIGIECVDHSKSKKKGTKKADVPWVELQHGKHRRLQQTDFLLLVSRTGFTWTAVQVAESLGYRAITPTITNSELSAVLNQLFWMRVKVAEISLKTATFTATRPDDSFQPVCEGDEPSYQNSDGSKRIPCIDLYKTLSMHDVAKHHSYFLDEDAYVIRQGDGTTGLPGGRDHLFGSG